MAAYRLCLVSSPSNDMHVRTACGVFRMANQLSVPRDVRRSADGSPHFLRPSWCWSCADGVQTMTSFIAGVVMSISQSIAKRVLPAAWFDRIRHSSERWMIQCTKCKSERSVWSAGGIRFGATSAGKRIAARCTTCGEIVAARVYLRDESGPQSYQPLPMSRDGGEPE